MAEQDAKPSGPDLSQGVAFTDLADGGMLLGHVGDEQVLLARRGAELFAVGAPCTHYHGPLAEGLLVGDTVRCPWHHACFSLRTGEALRAPALSPIACWSVEQRDGKVFVGEKRAAPAKPAVRKPSGKAPDRIVIVGGGAAGFAAAEMLRREQLQGQHRHAEQRRCRARRPAEPLQGLSRRQRAGGVGPAARRRLLRGQRHRPAAQGRRRRASMPVRAKWRWRTAARSPTTGCCSRPAPSRCACRSRAPTAARPHAAHARRQPRDHRARQGGQARRRDRRELHRARGRRLAARTRHRGPCRGAGEAADGAHAGPGDGRLRARLHEEHGVVFHLEDTVGRDRRQAGHAEERRHARRGPRGRRRRRAAAPGAGGEGRPRDRSRRGRRRVPGRPARRTSSRRATSRAGPTRTAGRRSASSTGWSPSARARPRRSTCSGCARSSTPCRSSGASTTTCRSTMSATPRSGTRSRSTATSRPGLPGALQAQRPHARRGVDLPRRREPAGRGRDGASSGVTGCANDEGAREAARL